jgi:hypothetical protein
VRSTNQFLLLAGDAATVVIVSAVRRVAKIAQYVPEGALARTEG